MLIKKAIYKKIKTKSYEVHHYAVFFINIYHTESKIYPLTAFHFLFSGYVYILSVVLYGCEARSPTLREKHTCGLRVFKKRELQKIFGPKKEKIIGD
jgi:hypothetical protein